MSITPGGNPVCPKCRRWYGPGVEHICDNTSTKPAAEESPEEGHTFRFISEIRSSSKVVGDPVHHDAEEFSGLPISFEVRAWSLSAALLKAADLPFSVLMADLIEQERADDAAEAAEGS